MCLNFLKYFVDNKQFWNYVKLIPLINTIFGSARAIRNLISCSAIKFSRSLLSYEDQDQEKILRSHLVKAIKSGLYAVAGIAAVLIPINYGVAGLWAFLLCSAINNVVGGFGSFIVDLINKEKHRNAKFCAFEQVIYERVIKVSPLFAVWYCLLRSLLYLIYDDERHAKVSAKDLIINIISIAVAYVVLQYVDWSKLVALIKEYLDTSQNGFAHVVLTCVLKLLTSQIFIISAAQCINVFAQLLRNSSLLMEARFPFNDPKKDKFIQCLQEPHRLIGQPYDSDNSYMKFHLIQYLVKCFVREPVDDLLYKNITKPNHFGIHESVLELAFHGENTTVLQSIIAFAPTLIEIEPPTIIDGILNENVTDSNGCVKYILRKCSKPSESTREDLSCCISHPRYKVNLPEPSNIHDNQELCFGTRILTIDGGGTRGVVSVELLRQIEKLCTGNIRDNFDWIFGTSTGGLIALLLAVGKQCEEIQNLYFELKDKVFCGRKGNVSQFEDLLKKTFGENFKMGDIPHPPMVVITTNVFCGRFKRIDFTNFDSSSVVPIWKVARCSTAAPGYFPPFEYNGEHLFDGGLTANNPVVALIDHLKDFENSTIVSIGTGEYNETVRSQSLYVSRSCPGFLRMCITYNLCRFLIGLVDQATDSDGPEVRNTREFLKRGKAFFYRLNPKLTEKLELNETDNEKLINAIWQTKVFARNRNLIIEQIAKRIKRDDSYQHNGFKFYRTYEDRFEEIDMIEKGEFGYVYKVKNRSDGLFYVIKIVEFSVDIDYREIKMMFELNNDFVVNYVDSWIEEKGLGKKLKKNQSALFIQMEWCSHNLRTFLKEINNEIREIFIYFICCELLKELIECVNYLHSLSPPIIHRDLKPENILISDGINGRFLKLCDFGFAKLHEKSDHTIRVGTLNYMAPEVINSRKYNTKSDIYSLALIATEIFRLGDDVNKIRRKPDLSKYSENYSLPTVKTKFNSLLKTLSKCLSEDYNSRPDSKQLSDSINEWTVDTKAVLKDENISDFRQTLDGNEILKKFFETKLGKHEIIDKLPQTFDINVKYYYQSGSDLNYFAIFVMTDDRVYCLGNNRWGKLGLEHTDTIYELTELLELRGQNIQEFYGGKCCMFARNDKNEIFSWGFSHQGILGRGFSDESRYLKPAKFEFFDDKNIIHICCGVWNCWALSADGVLYKWGINSEDQLASDYQMIVFIPIIMDLKDKIQFIGYSRRTFFVVTFSGSAYYCNEVDMDPKQRKIQQCPLKLIPLKNVTVSKIVNLLEDVFIILDNLGKVFVFNVNSKKIFQIKCEEEFIDLYYIQFKDYCLLLSKEYVFELKGNDYTINKLVKTEFYDFYDYYTQNTENYEKTIEITRNGYLMTKNIRFDENEKKLILENEWIFPKRYKNMFEEITRISSGGYGTVYKVMKKSDKLFYAVKILEKRGYLDLKEFEMMSKLNNNFVVQYIDSWIEEKVLVKKSNKIQRFLFIQMELCSYNLKTFLNDLIKLKPKISEIFKYFICCELLIELIECVNYLHSLNPPIIHEDLKPENILISDGINGRFLKLCDFGPYEEIAHSNTLHYMATEVIKSGKYSTKSDIFTLAFIATEILLFEENFVKLWENINMYQDLFWIKFEFAELYSSPIFKEKFYKLMEILSKCFSDDYNSRPDSKHLLNSVNKWTIDTNTVLNDINITDFRQTLDENEILKKFFETKLRKISNN